MSGRGGSGPHQQVHRPHSARPRLLEAQARRGLGGMWSGKALFLPQPAAVESRSRLAYTPSHAPHTEQGLLCDLGVSLLFPCSCFGIVALGPILT